MLNKKEERSKTENIVVSMEWRKQASTYFIIEFIMVVICLLLFSSDLILGLIVSFFVIVVITIAGVVVFCAQYRLMTKVQIDDNYISSYLLRRQLCVIDMREQIYYVKFKGRISRTLGREFIIVSNEPFVYYKEPIIRMDPTYTDLFVRTRQSTRKALLYGYNTKKQILLPYTEKTKSLFECEKWTLQEECNKAMIYDHQLLHLNLGMDENKSDSIVYIDEKGNPRIIKLDVCAKNYKDEHPERLGLCVGERKIDEKYFIFYTSGIKTKVLFKKKFVFPIGMKLLTGERDARFLRFQKLLDETKYTTRDIS